MTIFFSLSVINYLWEIAIFSLSRVLYPVNEIPLEDIFLSCAKFNEIKIFDKTTTSRLRVDNP